MVPRHLFQSFCFLLIFILQKSDTHAQDNSYIFRSDLSEIVDQKYGWEHTFLGIPNNTIKPIQSIYISPKDSVEMAQYQMKPLIQNIDALIPESTNVLIISEHHNVVHTRNTIIQLIESLKKKGFTEVFIEGLNYDQELMQRGYPIQESGFYLNEPTFGKMIRKLIAQGFVIYPYEQLKFQMKSSERAVLDHLDMEVNYLIENNQRPNKKQYIIEKQKGHIDMSIRDYSQYKNIMTTLDPSKKSIILCGHGHGIKVPYGGWRPLGYWLDRMPKLNVFSIENSETVDQEDNILNKYTYFFNGETPYYLEDTNSQMYYSEKRYQPYTGKHIGGLFDVTIFYPVNAYQDVSPLANVNDACEEILVPHSRLKLPFVIAKFIASEYEKGSAVPTEVTLINSTTDIHPLFKCPNERVFLWDGQQKIEIE